MHSVLTDRSTITNFWFKRNNFVSFEYISSYLQNRIHMFNDRSNSRLKILCMSKKKKNRQIYHILE